MISAKDALSIVLETVKTLEPMTISLQHSLSYVLSEACIADENVPSFDNAAMDGYAVRLEDVRSVPVSLRLVGEIPAGSVAGKMLQSGEAMYILTGAKIPEGCDAVIQQEWTEQEGETVKIMKSVFSGHNIRPAGADIKKGNIIVDKGQLLRPQEIGLLASLGKRFVSVYRRPIVAILATGSELIDLDEPLREGKIRNSNTYILTALLQEMRCEVKDLGIAKDDMKELKQKIAEGLKFDVLLTCGGVSVGKYDVVLDVFRELGVEIKFWKVNIKPGMPLAFGVYQNNLVFGLPGNPVSTMVTFLQFVKPALMKMMGLIRVDSGFKIWATLAHEIEKTDGKLHFSRGILESQNGMLLVRATASQASNVLSSLSEANCLIILPEDKNIFHKGELVEVQLL